MKRYTLLKSSLEDGKWYVVEIVSKEHVMAGPHKECVYAVTRLNESDLSPEEVINEIETNNKKWVEVTPLDELKEIYKLAYDGKSIKSNELEKGELLWVKLLRF